MMMLLLSPAAINAFTFNALNIPSPVLDKFVHDTTTIKKPSDAGTLLDVQLNIGKDDMSRLILNGAVIELLPDNIQRIKSSNTQVSQVPMVRTPNLVQVPSTLLS